MSRIEGKVASILNERELVISVGSDDGVEIGMQFNILYPGGIAIRNPDNAAEILDSIEWPKTQVKVVQVRPRVAVARTFRTIQIPSKGVDLARMSLLTALDYTPARTEVETLRTSGSFAEKEIDPKESVVKIGDPVVQVGDPA